MAERMSRQDRRHKETRDEILKAAREIVAEKGARNLSLREVARRADFSAPALYRYFEGGKEEIMLGLGQQVLERLAAHFRRVPRDLPPDERFVALGLAYIDFARIHADELALMVDSLSALDTVDVENGLGLLEPTGVFEIIDEVAREGVAAGLFTARDEQDVALMWHGGWALAHGMAYVERMHEHHEELFGDRAADVLRAYVNGLKSDWAAGGA